ncbi:LysR family transcriptional regulator [Trinickia violacea]|uniref:LysR family transcriptional regulator n=1 Tax=Trinickia violacea TaxID=2571746 RepID=A0A4P8IJY2_9BURK|nr:LysR family transcriptional regulator [Trinickia violacea]QCP49132.1 LysR family transcriptional regulator [Trinickia violacea]
MSIELSDMRFFVEAVRHGSITRASLELDIPKSSGSRRITRMEKELGVQLVKRTTRKVNATPVGKAYFDRCVLVLEEVARAEQMVSEERSTPAGRLRIAIPAELGAQRFAACFAEFMQANPGISMEVEAGPGSRLVDVVASDVDVWIKTGDAPDSNLIVRRLGVLARSLYASPAYLERHPAPTHPEQLDAHECLLLGDQPYSLEPWSFTRGSQCVSPEPPSNMWVNSLAVLRQLTVSGLGLAVMPDLHAQGDVDSGRLVKVMTDWAPEPIEVNLLMSHRELLPARIRSFVDFMVGKARAW